MATRSRQMALKFVESRRAGTPIPAPQNGEEAKSLARGLAESTPPKRRLEYAQSFCAAALVRYWRRLRTRRAVRPCPPTKPVADEAAELAIALGDVAAGLAVDDAAYLLGTTYAAMLPPDFRSRHGVFYTPPAVVDRLLDAATNAGVDWSTCRVLDPACGGGAFLAPVARRMIDALEGCERRVIARNIATRLRGYELDAFAAWMSQVFLDATLYLAVGSRGSSFEAVEVCDALTRSEGEDFDLVIGNPPYGRVTLSAEQRAQYKRSLYGHANLYGVFLDLALRRVKPNGVIAYVTPTSFLSGEYFKRLRGLLAEESSPASLDFVAARTGVFDDVLQETLLAVHRRGCRSRTPEVHFMEATASAVTASPAGTVVLPKDGESPWILPRSPDTTQIAAKMQRLQHRLRTWGYRVSTGPLVWNRFKEQLRRRPGAGTVPLIWAEAVSADGVFGFRAARRNHAPYFRVCEGDGWLLVERPCVLLQRTTSKEQPRRLIAAELPPDFLREHGGAVTVENHLNMLVPIVDAPCVDTATLAAFLNSAAADRAFRCISGSVAVSAYELEAMPLPSPKAMLELSRLLRRDAPRSECEELCARLYGGV